jgi:hypothetical protein
MGASELGEKPQIVAAEFGAGVRGPVNSHQTTG